MTDHDQSGTTGASLAQTALVTTELFTAKNAKVASFISEAAEFVGDLKCKEGLRIAGVVRGDIECLGGDVVVEASGKVIGSITANGMIFVDGTVGESTKDSASRVLLKTAGLIALTNNAKVIADIAYGELMLQGRQRWNGSVTTLEVAETSHA